MEIIKIGLCIQDKDFAKAFSRGLMRESRAMSFQIIETFEQTSQLNFIITDHTQSPIDNSIFLVDSIDDESLESSPLKIFKYRDSSQVIKALFFIIFQRTGKIIEYRGNRKSNVLTLCQLGGGQGATSISLSLIHFLQSVYEKKCIYINLNIVNDMFKYINSKEIIPPLKLAYYLEGNKDFPIDSFIENDGDITFVNCGTRNVGINGSLLLKKLENEGIYDFIICDIGASWTKKNLETLENSDCIVCINSESVPNCEEYYKNNLDYIMVLANNIPLVKIKNFANEDSKLDEWLQVSEDNKAFSIVNNKIHIDYRRNYGNEIQWICDKVMEATYEVK